MQTSGTSSQRASNALAPARTVTRRDAFRLLIGAGVLAFASPVAAFATSQSDIDAAQSDADAAQSQLDQISQEVSDLSAQLSDTVGQIDDVSAQIDQTQADIDAKEADIEKKQQDIDTKQQEIEQKQEVLGQRMSAAFKSGNASTLDLLLSSASFEELTSNIYYLDKVSEQDNSMIEEVKSLKADLETQICPRVVAQVKEEHAQLLIVTGMGACYPVIRTHRLVEVLDPKVPVLVMFPGRQTHKSNGSTSLDILATPAGEGGQQYRARNIFEL